MGIFTDHYRFDYKGNVIEVEGRVVGPHGQVQYDLVVNNKKSDQIEGIYGTFFLRGELPGPDGKQEAIGVEVSQGDIRE